MTNPNDFSWRTSWREKKLWFFNVWFFQFELPLKNCNDIFALVSPETEALGKNVKRKVTASEMAMKIKMVVAGEGCCGACIVMSGSGVCRLWEYELAQLAK